MSPISSLILVIWDFFFLGQSSWKLAIFINLFKKPAFSSVIFFIISLVFIWFISALIFIIFFLLLALDLVVLFFPYN